MPAHAILITYRDLEYQHTRLVSKATLKYEGRFQRFYFDSGFSLRFSLLNVADRIPKTDKLKIFISGHGDTGSQYITANDRVRKQTVDDLAFLLSEGLRRRATSMGDSANTEVNMVSCLFGRTPDGGLDGVPAVRLHRKLAAEEVYVDLVARTEEVAHKALGDGASGRITISLLSQNIDLLKINKLIRENRISALTTRDTATLKNSYRRKAQFTKIRCTYKSGAAVVLIRDYDRDMHIDSDSLNGRRILWADNVTNQLVKYITPPSGQTKVTDERHKILYMTVKDYDEQCDPERLFDMLALLIRKPKIGITSHSDTVVLIKKLLSAYPRDRLLEADLIENYF
jgi:hypothetical protein